MSLSEAFSRSARRYDLLTRLNPGYRRELRRAAKALAHGLTNKESPVIWDLGCGTGLSTQALLDTVPDAHVIGVDASDGMLNFAREKSWPNGTEFILERVENLASNDAFDNAPDGVFAAYLLRNVPEAERTAVLTSIRELMKPGTPLVLHDYSVSESRWAQAKWTIVCFAIIIPLATLAGAKTSLFTYLWKSVLDNEATATVLQRLVQAGFHHASVTTAKGWHREVLHTYTAVNQEGRA